MYKQLKIVTIVWIILVIGLLVFVMPGRVLLPQYYSIGGLNIHYYGLVIAGAVLAAWYLLKDVVAQVGITKVQFENLLLVLLAGGFVGARVYHVLSIYDYYLQNPTQVLAVWNGGLAIFGAVVGGLLSLYIYNRTTIHANFLKLLDFLVPGLLIGQVFGRLANLFNYEAYGLPTNLPWKLFIPEDFRIFPYDSFSYFHPVFLYESLACLLLLWFLVLYNDFSKEKGRMYALGSTFCAWLLGYGIIRFVLEFLRVDSNYLWGIKQNFVISAIMIVIALGTLLYLNTNHESVQT